MEILLKLSAAALLTVVLLLILEKQEKHIAVLLCIFVCCMIVVATIDILQPVRTVIKNLQQTAEIDGSMLSVLLKSTVTAVLCEITGTVCAEAGYGSLGKALHFTGICTILYLSMPLFSSLLELITQLLGGL